MFKKFFENRRRKKILLENAEVMNKFITRITQWDQGCGCPSGTICEMVGCRSEEGKAITLDCITEEAQEILESLK